jgi:PAS domain S-box-containing protein
LNDERRQGSAATSSTTASDGVGPGDITDEDLAVFLDMSTELFGVFDPVRGLAWSNVAAAAALGYSPDELRGVPTVDLVHPDDFGTASAMFEQLSLGCEPSGVEMRYRCKDGGWKWMEWTARMAPDTGLIYGAGRDVTDRHESQSELRANEARLRAILDHSTAAIWVKDLQGRYILVNDAFLRALGLRPDDVIGKSTSELWPSYPVDDVDESVLRTGQSLTRDDRVEGVDGPNTFITVRFPLRDASDQIVGVVGIATDISERTRVESALAEHQRLLETVIQACPDIVTVLDDRGRVHEISEASLQVLGRELLDPVHEEVESIVHPDDLPIVRELYSRLFTDHDAPLDVRYRVQHSDGRWLVLDTRAHAMVGDDGRTTGAVVVSRDITAELEVESELRASAEAAERASRAKSEFLSRMSHELRTPLNSVLGFAQLLEMDELSEAHGEAVGHVVRAGRHLLDLIDEVLDVARIESGNLELSLEAVPVLDVVADAADLARPMAEATSVDIVVDASGASDVHVRADRQRLLQVLLNLLSNAVKYNVVGGRVDVRVWTSPDRMVHFTVADTGVGIDASDIDRVFEPFDRLGAESRGVEGTGIGLTLTRHLVEHMGGSISVLSDRGTGTTFTVELPETSAPHSPTSDGEQGPERMAIDGSLRVLHVEDNLANLELVEQILTRSGVVDLYAAMSGTLGLELAREHRPDLVLLDLHLPDMTGLELLRRLRAEPRTEGVAVVVITADATPEQVQRLQRSGVAAYLTKPIDVRELLRVVNDVSTHRQVGK